ncbi:glycosyltransferase 87 family protein [Streptomyces sp. HB2AG]|uniref:glycosyltransferase 87 family protein n=1 Tax=Streptomyces sp. HB2AG TaxID=2983400 RepID=UPI0022AB23DC|nr:glycosyltransferase 87 family protein [Streptomyces sp. HB2AG]MCZ2523174.1 glycosyltransferase 87 family protein [Streptomyces sp. HB2AG]
MTATPSRTFPARARGLTAGRVRAALRRRPVPAAAALCLLSFAGFWAAQRAAEVSMIDLMVYRAEGWTVRTGGDLYAMRATHAELPATYPPFAALLFVPLTWVGTGTMRTVVTAGNLALLVALVHLSLRLLDRAGPSGELRGPARPAAVLLVSALAVWCEPVWTTLRYGQVNLLLAVLVLWDLTRRPGHRWAGAGIGLAAGIKLTPGLFALFLALVGIVHAVRAARGPGGAAGPDGTTARGGPSGRGPRLWNPWLRAAATAAACFTATVLAAVLALPSDSRRFWTEAVFAAGRVGFAEDTANQSLRGVLARALHTGDPGAWWAVTAAVVAACGLAVAVGAAAAGPALPHGHAWAVVTAAVTALLVSPVSWSHHWVWGVPLVLLLGREAARRRSRAWWAGAGAAGLVFCSFGIWLVPHGEGRLELHQGAGEAALSALYPAVGAAFLLLATAVLRRAVARTGTAGRDGVPAPDARPSPLGRTPSAASAPDGGSAG